MKRITRSGNVFSPFECPSDFDFGQLLKESTAAEESAISEGMDSFSSSFDLQRISPAHPASSLKRCADDPPPISGNHKRRKKRRDALFAQEGYSIRNEVVEKYVKPAKIIQNDITSVELPATQGAYQAKISKAVESDAAEYSLEDLKKMGFRIIPWTGKENIVFVGKDGRINAVAVAAPDETFVKSGQAVFDLMIEEGKYARFEPDEEKHRRGQFPAVNVGVTHAKGTTFPVNINNHQHTEMVTRLLADINVQRLASFSSYAFQLWAPKVHAYYKDHLDPLFVKMPELKRIFPKSVFPSAAFNFGPDVWTYKHRDVLNCPFGFCAIHALGNFNPKTGGHMILWEMKVVIEFPPYSVMLLPSATITHSNCRVTEGEMRASFTQYCAGGLFRYVDYGFRTEKELKKTDPEHYREMQNIRPHRWKMGLNLLSKMDDF